MEEKEILFICNALNECPGYALCAHKTPHTWMNTCGTACYYSPKDKEFSCQPVSACTTCKEKQCPFDKKSKDND